MMRGLSGLMLVAVCAAFQAPGVHVRRATRTEAATLSTEVEESLRKHLSKSKMLQKVVAEARCEGRARYTGLHFEPLPYSAEAPKGCPPELERYLEDDRYLVVNIPPTVMFKAKCFKPSKLCAIYECVMHALTRRGAQARTTRPAEVSYVIPSTAAAGPIGDMGFDYGTDDEFAELLV